LASRVVEDHSAGLQRVMTLFEMVEEGVIDRILQVRPLLPESRP